MRVHFIEIEARRAAGATEYVRFTSVDDAQACTFLGQTWVPAIERLPTLSYDFFGGDFAGRIETPTGTFTAALSAIPHAGDLRFAGASVTIWESELGSNLLGNLATRFKGRISTEPSTERAIVSFSIRPDDAWLDKPLLKTFAGTGGIEGPDDLEGAVKPLLLGACRFAPGTLIDSVDLVYCVSGHGPVAGVTAVYDRVVSLGASSGDFADLAALLAATIPEGSWGTCNALGLVRLGAPPDGQISFDVSGDNKEGFARRPGEIISRIASLAGGTVVGENLSALDDARPWNLTLALISQTTAREVIQQLADSVCAVAGVSHLGHLFVAPLGMAEPSLTLDTAGRSLPPVEDIACQPIGEPYWRLATNAEITWVVHAAADVGTGYVYRGRWNADRVYRLDDLVEMEDGSAWIYVSETAGAGIVPGTDPAVWRNERDVVGQPGVSPLSASALPPSVTVPCTYNGTPKDAVPGFTVVCFQGDDDVTLAAITGFTASGLTGVSRSGAAFTVAGMTADTGYVEINFGLAGSAAVLRVPYAKSRDGAPYVTGRDNISRPTGMTYMQVASLSLLMGPGGTISIDANGAYYVTTAATAVEAYFEISLNGGASWAAIGSPFAVTPAFGGVASEPGDFTGSVQASGASVGLTTTQTVMVRIMMRKTTSTNISTLDGSLAVSWAAS